MTRLMPPLRKLCALDRSWAFRAICNAVQTDSEMESSGWSGVWPGLLSSKLAAALTAVSSRSAVLLPGSSSHRWAPRRSRGGEAALFVAAGLCLLAIAAAVAAATLEPGRRMGGLAGAAVPPGPAGAGLGR